MELLYEKIKQFDEVLDAYNTQKKISQNETKLFFCVY